MDILFLDFETFYSDDYSLRKMPPPNYILDPRYELIGCAAALNQEPSRWVDAPDFDSFIKGFDPSRTMTVTFNALFDNCILAWKHGFIPYRMLCSMRMAAALRGHILTSVSLSNVAKVLGLGEKGNVIQSVKGMHRAEIMCNPGLWRAFQAYANNDNELSRDIFYKLIPEFPVSERRVMDHVLRCAVEPEFMIDQQMLEQHLLDIEAEQAAAMEKAGITDVSDLRSNDKFEALLLAHGIDIEYKTSPTGKEIPAFAKTDEFMADLQEHDDPIVQALVAGRLGARSTIERTRGEKILSIASLPWPAYCRGNMPIPLRYSGAHTHRLSGEWKVNMQNLPAGRGTKISKLRKALIAPPGYKVLVADLSQIECRICAWLCGELDLLSQFRSKKDPYSILASKIFGFIVQKELHKLERFIGKSGVLGLGFGCGKDKFYNMVLRAARGMGMNMEPLLAIWTSALAEKCVQIYRSANYRTAAAWKVLQQILETAWEGHGGAVRFGPGGVVEIGHGYVLLPNGMKLNYDVLPRDPNNELCYRYGKKTLRMYGPKFLENIVQALARIVVMNASLRLWDLGYHFKLQAHDELAFIVRKDDVENAKQIVLREMRRPPSWGQGIPLDAEADYGDSYGDAK
ncbi:MAG: hypothetical protein KGL39_56970 [Patescibacteria group bacterium]|nr:hypothetical protein [Patescibacteria group bacterium]